MNRTDIHRPSAIVPEEYRFVAFDHVKIENLGDCEYAITQRRIRDEHMKATGGAYSQHEHGGSCMICGNAMATYTATFYHEATNSYLRVGQNCAEKLEMSAGDWNEFRKAIHNSLAARAGKKKALALLEVEGLGAAWTIFLDRESITDPTCKWCSAPKIQDEMYGPRPVDEFCGPCTCGRTRKEERTIMDIIANVVKYGELSEARDNYLHVLLDRIAQRPAIEAKRKVEADAAAPCPTGRVKIVGEVITIRVQDSDFGQVTKMLVRDDSGFKVWGTRPSGSNVDRGDRIEFMAAVTPSPNDPKFGFYKRPTQYEVLAKAAQEVN